MEYFAVHSDVNTILDICIYGQVQTLGDSKPNIN